MKSPWLRNIWVLLVGGLVLVLQASLGIDRFSSTLHHLVYSHLVRTTALIDRQIGLLFTLGIVCGVLSLLVYFWASFRGVSVLAWLVGERDWRGVVLAVALLNSAAFLAVRIVRDTATLEVTGNLPYEGRRAVLYLRDPRESEYLPAREFTKRAASIPGNVVISQSVERPTAGPALRGGYLHFAYLVFPRRVYIKQGSECSLADVPESWLSERDIQWAVMDCKEGERLRPIPLSEALKGEAK
ncbi:MAG: hypothetical protein AB1405_11400 [Bdellovibrionota bacterium]